MIGVEQQGGVGLRVDVFLRPAVFEFKFLGVLRIAVALRFDEMCVPNGVQAGIFAEPFHFHRIPTFIIHMRHVHRAVAIAAQVHHKPQGMGIAFTGFEYSYQTIECAKHITSFCGIVNQRVSHNAITQSSVKILKMPVVVG